MSALAQRVNPEDRPAPVRVPLLGTLLHEVDEDRRFVVLDLGSIRGGTLDVFGGRRCRIDVLDLTAQLPLESSEEAPDPLPALLQQRLPPARGEQVDLVLCWNLLNYLDEPQMQALLRALEPRLAPDVRVHALIESSATHMSQRPTPVSLCAEDALQLGPAADPSCPAPRYSLASLERGLPGFRSERTLLLSNGQREYLFKPESS